MLKQIGLFICVFMTAILTLEASAEEVKILSSQELKNKVHEITLAQNKAIRFDATVADADELFSLFTDDFVYIHEVYGGTYTREKLYGNSIKYIKAGHYTRTDDRYKIVSMIPGHNGVAIERQQTYKGVTKNHLAVFEFRGDKVSRIIEYWK